MDQEKKEQKEKEKKELEIRKKFKVRFCFVIWPKTCKKHFLALLSPKYFSAGYKTICLVGSSST